MFIPRLQYPPGHSWSVHSSLDGRTGKQISPSFVALCGLDLGRMLHSNRPRISFPSQEPIPFALQNADKHLFFLFPSRLLNPIDSLSILPRRLHTLSLSLSLYPSLPFDSSPALISSFHSNTTYSTMSDASKTDFRATFDPKRSGMFATKFQLSPALCPFNSCSPN